MPQAAEDDADDPDDADDADDPDDPDDARAHSVGNNSAARRNNHAEAIKPHTWRKPSGRYDPQRQQRRRTSASAGGVASIMRQSFPTPGRTGQPFPPFPPRRLLFLYIISIYKI